MHDFSTDDHDPLDLSDELLAWIKPELAPGEHIIWASYSGIRPAASMAKLVKHGIVTFISFGIAGVSVLIIDGRFMTVPPPVGASFIFLYVFSILVGCLALLFTIGRMFMLIEDEGTVGPAIYALTEQRAIIWKSLRSSEAVEVVMFHCGSIKTLHRLEYRDGSGNLIFNQAPHADSSIPRSGFEAIANVRRVEDLIRQFLLLPDTSDELDIP